MTAYAMFVLGIIIYSHILHSLLWSMDEPILLIAARFKASYRVSFADAIIAAYAAYYHAVLLHKDPQFEALTSEIDLETLPYKAARP